MAGQKEAEKLRSAGAQPDFSWPQNFYFGIESVIFWLCQPKIE